MRQMKHCTLEKKTPEGTVTIVAWIPEEQAKVGKVLAVKNNDVWSGGWIIKSVPSFSVQENIIYRIEK